MTFRTGELCDFLGIGEKTLRLYEQRGLLTPEKDENGYRIYGDRELRRILEIKKHQGENRTLADISGLLEGHPFRHQQKALAEQIGAIEAEIGRLQEKLRLLSTVYNHREYNYARVGTCEEIDWQHEDHYLILASDFRTIDRKETGRIYRVWAQEPSRLNLLTVVRLDPETGKPLGCETGILNKSPDCEQDSPLVFSAPRGNACCFPILLREPSCITAKELEPLLSYCRKKQRPLPDQIYLLHNFPLQQDGHMAVLYRGLAF